MYFADPGDLVRYQAGKDSSVSESQALAKGDNGMPK
jgi:hypothetical protein